MSIVEKTLSIFSLNDETDNLIAGAPVYIKNLDGSLTDIYGVSENQGVATECGNDVQCGDDGQRGDYLTYFLEPQNNPVHTDSFGQVSIWADNSSGYMAEIISDAPKNTGLYARDSGGWELFATYDYLTECGNDVQCGDDGQCGDYIGITPL